MTMQYIILISGAVIIYINDNSLMDIYFCPYVEQELFHSVR